MAKKKAAKGAKRRAKKKSYEKDWDDHWSKLSSNLFGTLATVYRKLVLGPTLSNYFERYFPKKGTFVECGSGSSQTSLSLKKHRRTLIAMDVSAEALKLAKLVPTIDRTVKGDIFAMPFKKGSLDGIWNLGVHEHFTKEQNRKIFKQYHTALKRRGRIILIWPPKYSLNGMGFRVIEFFVNLTRKDTFRFYPDEINKPVRKSEVRNELERSGFHVITVDFPMRDLWGDFVVVAEKRSR